MSFLDRFKIQPKHKSADPEVRAASVEELGPGEEDAATLLSLAREDSDARVRRAAIARLQDVGVLAAIAESDPDPAIREELIARLAGVAVSADAEGAGRALAALTDQKQIANVAKTSPVDTVRAEAVARLTDVKSLSSVARHAADARAASLATERIQDRAELLNIAAKTDHKDAGVSALERAVAMEPMDREALEGLANRTQNKTVAKRARAMVQAMDEAESARRTAIEQHQQRVAGLVSSAEALGASTTTAGAAEQIDQLETDWRDMDGNPAHEVTGADRARFTSAIAAAREMLERERREQAEREARDAELTAARGVKTELCERVEALAGDDALDRLEIARSEWEGLAQDPDAELHEKLATRFQEACARARSRHENRQESVQTTARLEELSNEAAQLAAQEDSPAYAWDSV
ncbi:MAG TPA: hypothetical protein VFD36_01785, partial [Kofleriaceae bacterium]|nr:hypothetical protein [Kofleriaceae bacterium]